MDVETLSQSQREAVSQLQALMNGADADVAVDVLESVDWDVQRAANMILDTGVPEAASATTTNTRMESFEIDDSEQQGLLRPNNSGRQFRPVNAQQSNAVTVRPLRAIIAFFALPFRLITSVLRFVFRLLRIPIPQFVPFTWSNLTYRPLGSSSGHEARAMDPKSVAERWVRALEEETGAVCISRSGRRGDSVSSSNGHGISSGADVAGPSVLTSRSGAHDASADADSGSKRLPGFFLGSYEHFARMCEKEAKVGCIIIVSDEHDDVAEFKRSTLTDPTFVKLIQENDMLVWGGDIRDKDAWSAAQKLQTTTYPFVAFIALQPRRSAASGTSSTPTLTILSRHQGPSIPSTTAPTAAQTLVTHLNEQIFPRVKPFLARIHAQTAERERERALRAEQDRAFEESRRRDKERVERRMKEEREAEEERLRHAQAEERAKQDAHRLEEVRKDWEARRMVWRRYERKALVMREPRPGGEAGRGRTMRVGLRMPDGRRIVRFFGEADSMTALYAYVDSQFIPAELSQASDPKEPPSGLAPGEEGLAEEIAASDRSPSQWWGFQLMLAYPRKEISWEPARKLGDIEALKNGGGQLVVEMVANASAAKGKQKQTEVDDEDGYETEED